MKNNCASTFATQYPNKLALMGIRFADVGGDGEGAGGDSGGDGKSKSQEQTFTQAQVDAIISQRLDQQAKNKFGDYEDLKTKAAGAKTLEERLGSLESELAATKQQALRDHIAAEHGISTKKGPKGEPSDADLFLTGSDEATLTAQASRLSEQVAERKKNGNVVPKEGGTTTEGKGDEGMREFAKNLFNRAD